MKAVSRDWTTHLDSAPDEAVTSFVAYTSEESVQLRPQRRGPGPPGGPLAGPPRGRPGSTSDHRELPSAKGGFYWAMHQGTLRALAHVSSSVA